MAVDVLRTQAKVEGALTSLTVGYLNPVWYRLRQYSSTFTAVADLGGGVLRVTGTAPSINDKIRLSGAKYDGTLVATVTAVAVGTFDVTGLVFLGTDSGHYVNTTQHQNLHVQTRLVSWDELTVVSKAISSWFGAPNLLVLIDLQSEILSIAYQREAVDYSLSEYINKSLLQYRLQYREVLWLPNGTQSIGPWVSINENVTSAPARKQIKEKYGNNLLEYILRESAQQYINYDFNGSLAPWLKTNPATFDWEWSDYLGGTAAVFNLPTANDTSVLYQRVPIVAPMHVNVKFRGEAYNPQFSDEGFDSPTSWTNKPNGWANWGWETGGTWAAQLATGGGTFAFVAILELTDYIDIPAGREIIFWFQKANPVDQANIQQQQIEIKDGAGTTIFIIDVSAYSFNDVHPYQFTLPVAITGKIAFCANMTSVNTGNGYLLRLYSCQVVQVPNNNIHLYFVGSNDAVNWTVITFLAKSTEHFISDVDFGSHNYTYTGFKAIGHSGNAINEIHVNVFRNTIAVSEIPGKYLTRFPIPTMWRHVRVDQFNDTHFQDVGTWLSVDDGGNEWTYSIPNRNWVTVISAGQPNSDFLQNQKSIIVKAGTTILVTIELFNLVGADPNVLISLHQTLVAGPAPVAWVTGKQRILLTAPTDIGGKINFSVSAGGGSSADVVVHSIEINQPTIPRPLSVVADFNSTGGNGHIVFSWLDINRNVIFTGFSNLSLGAGQMKTYLLKNAPSSAHFVTVYNNNATSNATTIEAITLRIRDFCNPAVLIEWENSLGGLEQWAFQRKHVISFEQAGATQNPFEFYEPDIENSNGNLGKNGSDTFFEMELADEFVQTRDIPWLHEIKTSKQVRVIFPNSAAIFCVVLDTTTPARSRNTYTEFRVRIRLPRNFSPSLVDPSLLSEQLDPYKVIE